mgnify:CR=1 FL=1
MTLLKNEDVLDTKQDDVSAANTDDALTILTQAAAASGADETASVQANEGKSVDIIDLLVADIDIAQQRQKALDQRLLAQNATAACDRPRNLLLGRQLCLEITDSVLM